MAKMGNSHVSICHVSIIRSSCDAVARKKACAGSFTEPRPFPRRPQRPGLSLHFSEAPLRPLL